jgi:hypothetical protein
LIHGVALQAAWPAKPSRTSRNVTPALSAALFSHFPLGRAGGDCAAAAGALVDQAGIAHDHHAGVRRALLDVVVARPEKIRYLPDWVGVEMDTISSLLCAGEMGIATRLDAVPSESVDLFAMFIDCSLDVPHSLRSLR